MLYPEVPLPTTHTLTRQRVRRLQRVAHLLAGAALLAYIYLTPHLSDGALALTQWVVVPVAVGSGVALWKWPKIRSVVRARTARP